MRRILTTVLVMVMVAYALPVHSAGVSYNGTRGLIRTKAADTVGKGKLGFQLGVNYYQLPDSTLYYGQFAFSDTVSTDAVVDYHMFLLRASLTYGLNEYFEIAANLDVRSWIRNPVEENGHNMDVYARGGVGDTQILAKVGIPLPTSNVALAGLGEVNLPTGSKTRGFSTDKSDFTAMGLLTLDFTDLDAFAPTRLHVNAGYRWNNNETRGFGIFLANYPDSMGFWEPAYPPASPQTDKGSNDQFLFNAAVEFPAPKVTFFVEFDWKQLMNYPVPPGFNKSTYLLTPGIALTSSDQFEFKVAGDINLNSSETPSLVQPPDWSVWASFSWVGAIIPQDRDGDGVSDKDDQCPDKPEDKDGFQDDDGCPDLDNDGDGIPDVEDKCPDLAEDLDGFEDNDGCPDLDNDLDGIPDGIDKCPNSPETFNGFQDEDGCPDERPIAERFVLKGVNFESGSAALTPDSYRVLDEVVRSLMAYPEVRVEIQGYTDSVGKAGYNLDLSQRRAAAVKQYLVNAGIDPTRLVARGFGEENPIATNSTPAGRAENRRIEFRRMN